MLSFTSCLSDYMEGTYQGEYISLPAYDTTDGSVAITVVNNNNVSIVLNSSPFGSVTIYDVPIKEKTTGPGWDHTYETSIELAKYANPKISGHWEKTGHLHIQYIDTALNRNYAFISNN
jgi:hypothetical protein